MGMIVIRKDGSSVHLPFDFDFGETIRGRLPNKAVLSIDDRDFDRRYGNHAVWTQGNGPYAVLAYCGSELTITRWKSLEEAVTAKRTIDNTGCGGSCAKAHMIIFCDPHDANHVAEQARIDQYVRDHPEALSDPIQSTRPIAEP